MNTKPERLPGSTLDICEPPRSRKTVSRNLKLAAGLVAAIAFDTALQLIWKTTVLETEDNLSAVETVSAVLSNPLFLVVVTLMAFQFFNWLVVLREADLSFAKPVASLSYAIVPILSVPVFHEAIDALEIAGVICVIAGVWFISRTPSLTDPTRGVSAEGR